MRHSISGIKYQTDPFKEHCNIFNYVRKGSCRLNGEAPVGVLQRSRTTGSDAVAGCRFRYNTTATRVPQTAAMTQILPVKNSCVHSKSTCILQKKLSLRKMLTSFNCITRQIKYDMIRELLAIIISEYKIVRRTSYRGVNNNIILTDIQCACVLFSLNSLNVFMELVFELRNLVSPIH